MRGVTGTPLALSASAAVNGLSKRILPALAPSDAIRLVARPRRFCWQTIAVNTRARCPVRPQALAHRVAWVATSTAAPALEPRVSGLIPALAERMRSVASAGLALRRAGN